MSAKLLTDFEGKPNSTSIRVNNLKVDGAFDAGNMNVNHLVANSVESNTLNMHAGSVFNGDVNIVGNMRMSSISGSGGQFLKKTTSTTQTWTNIIASDIGHGTANQVLVTNSGGTGSQWSSNINVGSATVNGELILSGDSNDQTVNVLCKYRSPDGLITFLEVNVDVRLMRIGKLVLCNIPEIAFTNSGSGPYTGVVDIIMSGFEGSYFAWPTVKLNSGVAPMRYEESLSIYDIDACVYSMSLGTGALNNNIVYRPIGGTHSFSLDATHTLRVTPHCITWSV